EDELLQLFLGLAQPLGIDPASNVDADKACALSERNLNLLYRHAHLSKHLRITLPELFALMAMADALPNDHVETTADVEALLAFHDWVTSTDWTLAELVRIRRPTLALSVPQPEVPDARALAEALVAQVAEAESLMFAETVFALLPPTSPIATSGAPVLNTDGSEVVTYTVTLAGEVKEPETIVLAAHADLDAVVADWNSKATRTKAYRSDAAGTPLAAGVHVSIAVNAGRGSTTTLNVTASPASLFAVGESRGAEVTEVQSREVFAANADRFESVDAQGRFRLKADVDPDAPLTVPATVDAGLGSALLEVLRSYHSVRLLPSLLSSHLDDVEPLALPFLTAMLGLDFGRDTFHRELRGDQSPSNIKELIEELQRLAVLFKDRTVFDGHHLDFITQEATLFGIADVRALTTAAIRNIETFRTLLTPWTLRDETTPNLPGLLRGFAPRFAEGDPVALAKLLSCDEGLLQSLTANIDLSPEPFEALGQLMRAVGFAQHVGMGGEALKLAQSANLTDLAAASTALQASFRAKYPDESVWEKNVEPFHDALLSRRRDGLVAYLVHSGAPQFKSVADLYHHTLLDVELEGCARTSRVASAIDSAQLYVHRCLMNLEQTDPDDARPAHVLPESVPTEEWEWRKHYRVWEANRKIFLYPENFIEPELRDNKTPLFKNLEEKLLSKELSEEAILSVYA
ncbi:MAG: neuraminidase-like domain-containing protein, partial [Myxococcota bacterium]